MQIKRIQCPNCRAVLDVNNTNNERLKVIKCPACKQELKITFEPKAEPLEAHTYYAAPKPFINDGSTQLAAGMAGATQLASPISSESSKTAKLVFGGKEYELAEGANIIGRKANTSTATVQIKTTDRYMSRQHCKIIVKTSPDGSKKVILSNYQNKNSTSVDNQEIATGDEIRLTDGNSITMGQTTVTFKMS
jgi:pSer/pThr/pTyr-binding forkhead associated (FHA) protein